MSIEKRVKIARKAIEMLRKKPGNWTEAKEKWPLTYGFYGLLDYIEYGKPGAILEPNLRRIVQKVIRESRGKVE